MDPGVNKWAFNVLSIFYQRCITKEQPQGNHKAGVSDGTLAIIS